MAGRRAMGVRRVQLLTGIACFAWGVGCLALVQPSGAPARPEALAKADAALNAGDFAAAAAGYQQAIDEGFDRSWVRARLGQALHALGRYEEAIPCHLKGAGINNEFDRSNGLYNAACAYAKLGKADEAIHYLLCAMDAGFTGSLEGDPDLEGLREDPRFRAIASGEVPRLSEQINFMVGEWAMETEEGEAFARCTIERTVEGSHAFTYSKVHERGGRWAGVLYPEPATRTWTWIGVDSIGTVSEVAGVATGKGMVFTGGQRSAAGDSFQVRMTFSPEADGRVLEVGEVSEDAGTTWRPHYRQYYVPVER